MKPWFSFLKGSATLLALCSLAGMAPEGSSPPDQVEEDWEVVVASPDSYAVGPQVTTRMSPTSDPSAAFTTFYLNYRDYPTWEPGGMQVKAYDAANDPSSTPPVVASDSQGSEVCQTEGETITWTQQMSVSGGSLKLNILNGQSTTWGKFGQGVGTLSVSVSSTVADLAGYKPDDSTSRSGVSWQSNRVTSMKLLQVRYFSGGELISTDTTPRAVVLTPSS